MPPAETLVGLPLAEGPPSSGGVEDQASGAAATLNLLPLAPPSLKLPTTGTYIGDGMPPVPAKLTAKILRWEFVEMGELLPEFWATLKETEGEKERRNRQGRKVTDIYTWLQCYAAYVAVLGLSFPPLFRAQDIIFF